MPAYVEAIRQAVASRYPLLYVQCAEEDRVIRALTTLGEELWPGAEAVHTWNCVRGLGGADPRATADPVAALEAVRQATDPGFYVMLELAAFFDRADVCRAVRDTYYALHAETGKTLVILAPTLFIPRQLEKEVHLVPVPLPDEGELLGAVTAVAATYDGMALAPDLQAKIALAFKGLTLHEAEHVMHRCCRAGLTEAADFLEEIYLEKELITRKSGYLEFVPPRYRLEDIGGLDNLKDWLVKRRELFTRDALAAGLPLPKGILIMGVSGCGKSMAAKAVSSLWQVPLFRLDMNLVFSGLHGSPEASFHHALRTVEAVAPAVLWIDEIENGLGMTDDGPGGGSQSHLFSAFLTWMQEKPPLIFIAATANRIQALPAEVIRKGRFDQVFFCDLPTDEEREQIWRIYLEKHGADPERFKLDYLVIESDGWNGAEIEQAVIGARIDAHQQNRMFENRDITTNTARMVPLSQTMREQIKALRDWAFGRAENASKHGRRR